MGLFVDLGCTVLYVQYVIHVSDAGIRTWYAATVTRCTTNELRTSLCQCGSWFLCVCRWRRNAGMSCWWLVRIIKILLKLLTSSIWDIVQCPLRKLDKNVFFFSDHLFYQWSHASLFSMLNAPRFSSFFCYRKIFPICVVTG